MKKLLIIEPLLAIVVNEIKERWAQLSYEIDLLPNIKEQELSSVLCRGNYDALIVRNRVIDRETIEAWTTAKGDSKVAIVRAGSNISTIDIKAARERGVYVMNTPGANSQAVAQFILTQLFILSGNVNKMEKASCDIKSNIRNEKNIYETHTFIGDRLALIGTGAIGSILSKMANSMGMIVQAYSPNLSEQRAVSMGAVNCKTIEEAFTDANYIAVQVPFTVEDTANYQKTFGMINKDLFIKAKRGACIVNVSRADIVNNEDLLALLQSGDLSGASLDILFSEIDKMRAKYPQLFELDNVYITPLIACESEHADREIATQSLMKVEKFFSNKARKEDTVKLM